MKVLLFVDDETRVLQGLQRQLRNMRDEWDMNFLDGGRKALEFMATRRVDVLVSDMMMPEMDGAELLTEVSKRHPNTVRIILSGHAEREAVLRLVGPPTNIYPSLAMPKTFAPPSPALLPCVTCCPMSD